MQYISPAHHWTTPTSTRRQSCHTPRSSLCAHACINNHLVLKSSQLYITHTHTHTHTQWRTCSLLTNMYTYRCVSSCRSPPWTRTAARRNGRAHQRCHSMFQAATTRLCISNSAFLSTRRWTKRPSRAHSTSPFQTSLSWPSFKWTWNRLRSLSNMRLVFWGLPKSGRGIAWQHWRQSCGEKELLVFRGRRSTRARGHADCTTRTSGTSQRLLCCVCVYIYIYIYICKYISAWGPARVFLGLI